MIIGYRLFDIFCKIRYEFLSRHGSQLKDGDPNRVNTLLFYKDLYLSLGSNTKY